MELNTKKIRGLMNDFMLYAWVILSIADFIFYLIFLYQDILSYQPKTYFLVKVVLPFLINGAIFSISNMVISSYGYSEQTKNRISGIGLTLICSVISVFHSSILVFWLAPCFGIVYSVIFQDKALKRGLYWISLCSIAASTIVEYHLGSDLPFHVLVETCVLSAVFSTLVYVSANILYDFFINAETMIEESDEKQKAYEERLKHDVLTKVYSRYFIDNYLVKQFKDLSLHKPISLAMTDIDNFKHVNDTYGHENGDEVLKRIYEVAKVLDPQKVTVARFGGEEFLFMFMDDDVSKHRTQMEEFRKAFSEQEYPFTDEHFTISAGLVTSYGSIPFDEVLAIADKALYTSKTNGKNQTTIGKI